MSGTAVGIPDVLHLCPRCGDLASGDRLCEECRAAEQVAKRVERSLRFAWAVRVRDGVARFAGDARDRAALGMLAVGLAGYVALCLYVTVRLIEVLR